MQQPGLRALDRGPANVAAMVLLCLIPAAVVGSCGTALDPVASVVESSASAAQLVSSLQNCTAHGARGHFSVKWAGHVELKETLHVKAGSTMNITGASDAVISGGGKVRLFTVGEGATLHLQKLTLRDGRHEFNNTVASDSPLRIDGGGAVKALNGSTLVVSDCWFYSNTVKGMNDSLGGASGGAIFAYAATVIVRESTFGNNSVPANFENYSAPSYPSNSDFYIIKVGGIPCYGGAIYASYNSVLSIEATAFKENWATNGAAIACTYSTSFNIVSSHFIAQRGRPYYGAGPTEPDSGSTKGGAIYAHRPGKDSAIAGCDFIRNEAAIGASIYLTQRTDESAIQDVAQGDTAFAQPCPGPSEIDEVIRVAGSSRLSITDSTFKNNVAVGKSYSNSGAILMERGVVELWVSNSSFENNTAPESGAVQLQADTPCFTTPADKPYENTTAIFTDCTFSGNEATGVVGGKYRGGAVFGTFATIGRLELRNCSLENNRACEDCSGGVAMFDTPETGVNNISFSVKAYDTVFANNVAGFDGGALFILAPTFAFSFSNTIFEGNRAGRRGGALFSTQNASITLDNCTLSKNSAGTSGGAVALEASSRKAEVRGTATTFSHNTAGVSGGGLYSDSVNLIEPRHWVFDDNISPNGQIVLFKSTVNATSLNVSLSGSRDSQQQTTASLGIVSSASTFRCVDCEFTDFQGSSIVISLAGNTTTNLDSCRFADALVATLVSSDNQGSKSLQVRNAELGENVYVQSGYDSSKFTSGNISLLGCEEPHNGGCEEDCIAADFGVICGSFYDVLDYGNQRLRRTTTSGVTAVPHSAESETPEYNFTFVGSNERPQFFFTVNGTAELSGSQRSRWMLGQSSGEAEWRFQPSAGILRAREAVRVKMTVNEPDLSKLNPDRASWSSNFSLYDKVGKVLHGSDQHASIWTSYYYCVAGEFQEGPNCSSCAAELNPRGVQCSLEHGESVKNLLISRGYWRENDTSTTILQCPNRMACDGGTTPSEYCANGYDGPYCATCDADYASTGLVFQCIECSPQRRRAVFIVLAILAAACLLLVVAMFSADNPVQCEPLGTVLSCVASSASYIGKICGKIPFSKLRIPLITLQILTQYSMVCDVQYPLFYERFLRAISFINLDLTIGISAMCLWPAADYYDRLLIMTLAPLLLIFAGGCVMWWWRQRHFRKVRQRVAGRPSTAAPATNILETSEWTTRQEHPNSAVASTRQEQPKAAYASLLSCLVTVAMPVFFLVYGACSTAIFAAFQCDPGAEYNKEYLQADYTIECNGVKYNFFKFYAFVMVAVYPVGTPIVFAWQLHQHAIVKRGGAPMRSASDAEADAKTPSCLEPPCLLRRCSSAFFRLGHVRAETQYTEFLWKPYREKRHYYEAVECLRRLLMTGMLVFLSATSRPTFGSLFAVAFLVVYASLKPFQDADDSQSYLTGLGAVFLQAFLSLIITTEVVASDASSADVAASCIITLVVLSWVMVIWQAVVAARGSAAVVSESLQPVWGSSRRTILRPAHRESEDDSKERDNDSRDSRSHISGRAVLAPAWGGV